MVSEVSGEGGNTGKKGSGGKCGKEMREHAVQNEKNPQ